MSNSNFKIGQIETGCIQNIQENGQNESKWGQNESKRSKIDKYKHFVKQHYFPMQVYTLGLYRITRDSR